LTDIPFKTIQQRIQTSFEDYQLDLS